MRNMYKNNTSVLIQERARLNVSKNLTICSLMQGRFLSKCYELTMIDKQLNFLKI